MPPETVQSREEEWRAIQAQLKELLSEYHRTVGRKGDCRLIEADAGTYEQKVLVTHKDAFNVELLDAVSVLLRDYSLSWSVLFLLANKDGSEATPPRGIRMVANGSQSVPPELPTREEMAEWKQTKELYDALVHLIRPLGTDDASKGDYWIIDDAWAPLSHKICIFNIKVLTPQLVEDVQQLLSQRFPSCSVWFQIEVSEPNVEVPLPGVRVYADHVEHDWDRERLRSIFKERFAW
jgi:hypothetical protein